MGIDRLQEAEQNFGKNVQAMAAFVSIKAAVAAGEIFPFGGEQTCEGCAGWDGISRRCECGNRRVYWSWDGEFWYGEAY